MKKKLLTVLLCTAMAFSLTACGENTDAADSTSADTATEAGDSADTGVSGDESQTAETTYALDKSWPEETVLIGVETFDTTSDQFLAMQGYYSYLSDYYNIDFMYSEALASAEDELAFIDSCASAGAKGIIGYYNIAGTEAIDETISHGMYYWGTEQYYDNYAENDHYVGCYTLPSTGNTEGNGDFMGGYEMGYNLGMQGIKHVCFCNGGASMGVQMFIDRQAGFEAGVAAAQAEGAEIIYDPSADVVEGWPDGSDFASAIEVKLGGDYDGIAAAFDAAALFQPILDSGKSDSIKVATIGAVGDTYVDFIESGMISAVVYECEEVEFGNAIVSILNAVTGQTDAYQTDGKAVKVDTYRWIVTDADSYNAVYNYHDEGNYFITAEDLAGLMGELNPGVTGQDVSDFYAQYTLEYAVNSIAE